jgi:hypothetical protein
VAPLGTADSVASDLVALGLLALLWTEVGVEVEFEFDIVEAVGVSRWVDSGLLLGER